MTIRTARGRLASIVMSVLLAMICTANLGAGCAEIAITPGSGGSFFNIDLTGGGNNNSQNPGGGSTTADTNSPGGTTPDGTSNSPDSTTPPANVDPCVDQGSPSSSGHEQMFLLLNQYRQQQGVPTLEYSKILEEAAFAHAKDMYDRDFFDHVSPSGTRPIDRAADAGFCRIRSVGENIAWNYVSFQAVQTGWENSPGHNANMISTDYRYVGMGYYNSPNGPYYVQVFGDVFGE